jgi:hypothetical protein
MQVVRLIQERAQEQFKSHRILCGTFSSGHGERTLSKHQFWTGSRDAICYFLPAVVLAMEDMMTLLLFE